MNAYKALTNNLPSFKVDECWQELQVLLPNHTKAQRLIITLWWTGVMSRRKKVLNKWLLFALDKPVH